MELTEKQLQAIEYYCGNNMVKLKQIAYPIFIKFGGITPKDYDDFYSEANKTVLGAVRIFDDSKGDDFEKFLKGCLSRKFKTLMTRRNRNKRIADRTCTSLDSPIGDENGITLADVLPSGFDIEVELAEEIGISSGSKMERYLEKLSKKQRQVVGYLSDGYKMSEIKELLHISEKEYSDCMMAIRAYKNIVINNWEDLYMVEPIREHTYSLSAYLDATKDEDIREDQDVQRLSGQWDTSMINELVYTVLTRDYILPIIIGEEDLEGGMTQLWLVDGVQRTSSFILFRFGNYKITSSISEPHKVIDYQVRCVDEDGDFVKDEDGNFVYETKTCNLVGKTFETLPKELQKEFDKYQIKTVIHQHCTMLKISELVRRYNNHKAMNAAQTAFTFVDKYARRIRTITEHKFFIECDGFSEKEKRNGVYERVVCETTMTMFHLDDWQKQSKKMGVYLNEHASDDEFDQVNSIVDQAFDMGLASYKQIFTAKDAFIWFALLHRFNNIESNSERFIIFLDAFVNELHSKVIDGLSFDEINANRATKDKAVIKRKLRLLEKLMRDFLHIEEEIMERNETRAEEFIAENVELNIEIVENDFDFYNQMLDDLEENTIKDGSKLLNPDNRRSLLALVAYSIKNDIDLDDWMLEYAKENNTYFMDQKKNYIHMKQDLEKYLEKKGAAA